MCKCLIYGFLALLLVTVVGFCVANNTRTTEAQVSLIDYQFEATTTNIYTGGLLAYIFDGLDASESYIWALDELDINTGNVIRTRALRTAETVTSATVFFTGVDTPSILGGGAWDDDSFFPFQVRDVVKDVVLQQHFVAPTPRDEWSVDQTVDEFEKQCISGCVYQPLNAAGYQHNSLQIGAADTTGRTAIIHRRGEVVLLHYRSNIPTDANEIIEITDIVSGSAVAEFYISELTAYNTGYGTLGELASNALSFVVMSTNGERRPWMSPQFDSVFVSGDNPFDADFPVGGYAYGRVDTSGPTLISEGESVWLVNTASDRREWLIEPRVSPIAPGGNQRLERRQRTEALHDAFPNQLIVDSQLGNLDSGDYDFATFRVSFYNVGTTPEVVTVSWFVTADDLYYGQDPEDFPIEGVGLYQIVAAGVGIQPSDDILDLLRSYGLDSVAGTLVLILLANIAGWIIFISMKAKAIFYLVWFTFIIGFLIFIEWMPAELTVILGIITLVMWVWYFMVDLGREET
jgi:hypothetical protein